MKPNTKMLRKWADALCSGEYIQGGGRLRNDTDDADEYCCLGVACDLVDSAQWRFLGEWTWDGAQYATTVEVDAAFGFDADLSFLSHYMGEASMTPSLTNLNDDMGWSFGDIAMLIYMFCEAVDAGDLVVEGYP